MEPSRKRRRLNKQAWMELNRAMTDVEFRDMFRMYRLPFDALMERIRPFMQKSDEKQSIRGCGGVITLEMKLCMTLRWLAGGSYLDICLHYAVSRKSFFKLDGFLWETIAAIDAALNLSFDPSVEACERQSAEFAKFTHGRMNGCVMAIDGLVIKTRRPWPEECEAIMSYRNRKSCWGLLCLAGCDALCRFTMFKPNNSGGTNDVGAWNMSIFKRFLNSGALPKQFYVIGDEAFVNTNQFLTPWSGTNIGARKDGFNFHLSSMRQCIERAFGMLTNRWGIFWRPFRFRYSMWCKVATVCAKLHNYCIDTRCRVVPQPYFEDVRGNEEFYCRDEATEDDIQAAVTAGQRPERCVRTRITEDLYDNGFSRPSAAYQRRHWQEYEGVDSQ